MTVRDHVVSVRLTDNEYKSLKAQAGKSKLSDILRRKLLSEAQTITVPATQTYTAGTGNTIWLNDKEPLKY